LAGDGAQGGALQRQSFEGLKGASAAHEVKNFAEALTNLVYLLQQNPRLDEDSRKYVALIEAELEQMRYVLSQALSRYREIANPVSLSQVLETVLQVHGEEIAFKGVQIEKRYDCDATVMADSEGLRQVFANLVVNALQALPSGGKLTIHVRQSRSGRDAEAAGFRVVVADNGRGIPRENRSKIFLRSFTTKGKNGTGLGLWMTQKIIQQYEGTIRFRSSNERGRCGTVFSVFLPLNARTDGKRDILCNIENSHRLHGELQRRFLSAKEKRDISRKLTVANHHLLADIRAQSRRFKEIKAKPISKIGPYGQSEPS
jgi:signal transduction histidine kinase